MVLLTFGIGLLLITFILFIMVGAAIKDGYVGTPIVMSIFGLILAYFSVIYIIGGVLIIK